MRCVRCMWSRRKTPGVLTNSNEAVTIYNGDALCQQHALGVLANKYAEGRDPWQDK